MKRLSAFVLLTTFVVLSLGWSYLPAAPQKAPAPATREAADPVPPAPTPIDQSLTFSETMLMVLGSADANLTESQSTAVENLFANGDTDPKVRLIRRAVYLKAVRHGIIPKGTPIDTINWGGLTALLVALIPMIQAMLLALGI
jgi:hypothetical protein